MLKKLILFIMFTLAFHGWIFSQSPQLHISVDKDNIDINNVIELEVILKQNSNTNIGNFQIDGLEKFDIVSQANSNRVQIINNDVSMINSIVYHLKAKETGKYTIGPVRVKVGTGELVSNIVEVSVKGEKIFMNGIPSGVNITGSSVKNPADDDFGLNQEILDSTQETKIDSDSRFNITYLFIGFFFIVLILVLILYRLWKSDGDNINMKFENNEKPELLLENKKELKLPDINDPNFKIKIHLLMITLFKDKYNIDFGTKTYSEIFKVLKNLETNKVLLEYYREIFEKLNMLKFGDLDQYKQDIANLFNKINQFTS